MPNTAGKKVIRLNRIIFILSVVGMIMGVYVLQSFLRQSSIICLTGGGCEAVRKSAVSYPFGIPVPAIGVVGYLLLTVFTFLRTANSRLRFLLLKPILGIAIFGICFVTWFTVMELFVIGAVCTWCAISAANMYVIFMLTLLSWRWSKVNQSH